ncbi:MAG: Light-sensor Protein kinase [Geoglossum simile]|nr:MAG: Light-sensor Protein kinase [Geoglossum simile]
MSSNTPPRRTADLSGALRQQDSSPARRLPDPTPPSLVQQQQVPPSPPPRPNPRRLSVPEFDSSISDGDTEEKVYPIRSTVAFSPLTRSYSTSSIASHRGPSLSSPDAAGGSVSSWQSHRRSSVGGLFGSGPLSGQGAEVQSVGGQRPSSPGSPGSSSSPVKRKWDIYSEPEVRESLAGRRDFGGATRGLGTSASGSAGGGGSSGGGVRGRGSRRGSRDVGAAAEGFITARFTHVATEDGHAVVTGRGGATLTRCEDEPIRIPGAVQGFGLLVALRAVENGKLAVRIVSENSETLTGRKPSDFFALPSFCDVMREPQAGIFLTHVDFIRHKDYNPGASGPHVFPVSILKPGGGSIEMWCAVHTSEENGDLIICEFELQNDRLFPTRADEEQPEVVDTLRSKPTQEDIDESTIDTNRPFRAPPRERIHPLGEATAMEAYDVMDQVQETLSTAPNLDVFVKALTGLAKQLTGFHRVMIYRFDESYNGNVVAELVDPRFSKDLYKGLRFPASDIPKQARELYRVNKVRILYSTDMEAARLVCRTLEDLGKPLDLTHSYLRAMSPIHIKYLKNMGARASMSITVTAFGDIWGLIACHAHGVKGMRVDFPTRRLCRVLGDAVSRNVERLLHLSRVDVRQLIKVSSANTPSGCIVATSEDLMKLFDADFGLLSIRDATSVLGKLEHSQESLAMLEYLRLRGTSTVFSTEDITRDFPDLHYAPGFSVIAGLLLVPLSITGQDFLVFFRKAELQMVKWGGNPYESRDNEKASLEPRKSFKLWTETISNRSRSWTYEQLEYAAMLSLVYGRFIDVWKAKEAPAQRRKFKRLLLANASHQLRTPLNAIINYLEIAMEGALDNRIREDLSRSYSASKFMICVINDLLDLTATEGGQDLTTKEVFDLPATIRSTVDEFRDDIARKNLEYETIEHEGFPHFVKGARSCVRQIVSNLVANAVQHTTSGSVVVDLRPVSPGDGDDNDEGGCSGDDVSDGGGLCVIEIMIQDTGKGMSPEKADALFRDLEQVENEEGMTSVFSRGDDDSAGIGTLGLDLAVVARLVSIMQGQLRLKSELGRGSRFAVRLPFSLPRVGEDTPASSGAGTIDPLGDLSSPFSRLGDTGSISPPRVSLPPQPKDKGGKTQSATTPSAPRAVASLSVLVAEDDPINVKVITRRLEMMGHKVHVASNGEKCAGMYIEDMGKWDIVLMDLQMPILDGIAATKLIRAHEHHLSQLHPSLHLVRVPIIAVSASAEESKREEYVAQGFDGWILKPVNFRRLEVLIKGVKEKEYREKESYREGEWDKGGWLVGGRDGDDGCLEME